MYVYKSTEVRKYHEVDTNEAVQHTTTTLYNYTYTATTPNRSPTVRVQMYTYFRKYSILSYLRWYSTRCTCTKVHVSAVRVHVLEVLRKYEYEMIEMALRRQNTSALSF